MMCSFAKFLALGLIASEGHGPVAVEAITEAVYKQIVGKASQFSTTSPLQVSTDRELAACQHLYSSYKDLLTPASLTDDLGIDGLKVTGGAVTTCTNPAFSDLKDRMLAEWKADALALGLTIASGATIGGGPTTNVKELLLAALQARYNKLAGKNATVQTSDPYNKRITTVKKAIWQKGLTEYQNLVGEAYHATLDSDSPYTHQLVTLDATTADLKKRRSDDFSALTKNAGHTISIAQEVLKRNPSAEIKIDLLKIQEDAQQYLHRDVKTAVGARKLLKETEVLLDAAKKIKADQEAAETGTAVGIVGTLLAAVAAAFAVIMSPCFACDFRTGKLNGQKGYECDPTLYNCEEVAKFAPPPKAQVEASTKGSALMFVPVGVLAGVCVVARRGLNKRRAQKKAKRASRTQEKLHEDL